MGTCVTKHHRLNVVTRQEQKQRTASTQRPSGISPLSISTLKNEGQELPSPSAGRKNHAVTVTTAAVSKQNIPNTNSGYTEKHVPQAMLTDLPTDASAYKKVNNQNTVDNKQQQQQPINDNSEIKNIQHKSVFLKATGNQAEDDDPIARIVRLEEACIRLKARLEKEKVKSLAKAQRKYSSHHQFGQNTEFFNDNDARCFATIIKLADFVQEKSQRLWEDPHDMEVQDALASLEYASKMLQLECLIDFQRDVAMALPPDSPIRQNHKHLLRAQSQQPPSDQKQESDPQLNDIISPPQPVLKKIQSQQPPQTQQITFLQLYPVVSQQNNPSSSDGNKKSTQHYLSPSQPQHSSQQEDEAVNDPELEILAPETKCQHQIFLPCNPSPDIVKKLSNATLPQANQLNPATISDPTLKQSNLAPKAPPQNQHSPFGSPVSPLVLDCQQQ